MFGTGIEGGIYSNEAYWGEDVGIPINIAHVG
jgi:hypothetical protein